MLIYKPRFTSYRAVVVGLAEVRLESTVRVMSFETGASKEYVANEVSINAVLRTRLREPLCDTSSTRKRSLRSVLFQKLGYHRIMPRYSASFNVEISRKWENVLE